MANFGGLLITNKGRALQAKAQTGVELKYTRMAIGDGQLAGQQIPNLDKLISEKMTLKISKLQVQPGGKAVVGSSFSNKDVAAGFYFREIGVFAKDPDVGEILYCYGNAGQNAEFIPPSGGADIIEKAIDVITIVGNAPNVTATIDSSLIFVTKKEFELTVLQVEEGIEKVREDLSGHEKATLAHGATADLTPNRIAIRDADGQFKVGKPTDPNHVARLMDVGSKPDYSEWTTRTTPVDNNWNNICYGNGTFVAISANGTGNRVMTSLDGVTWTLRQSAADINWRGVCYGNGLFVAVSSSGTGNRIMTSPDGINWTLRQSAADNTWNAICYGNGMFVVVDGSTSDNKIMTSPDGINWTVRPSPANNNWSSVCYGGGLFVAVCGGSNSKIMTSPDGINWTVRPSPANHLWMSVCYGNGLFVAVSRTMTDNQVMTSPDGINWILKPSAANNSWASVCYGNGLFVAVATTGTDRVMTSPDGVTWTAKKSASSNNWTSVCYGDGLFVAVSNYGTAGRVMTSGKLGATARASEVFVDSPTLPEKDVQSALERLSVGNLRQQSQMNDLSIVVDTTTWVVRESGFTSQCEAIAYGNGVFVAVGTNGGIATSSDSGASWTNRTSGLPTRDLKSVCYGNGMFVAVPNSGTEAVVSTDNGASWTKVTIPNISPNSVAYGNGIFVGLSRVSNIASNLMTSTDGINWTARVAPSNDTWNGLTFGNGMFVAVASSSSTGAKNRVMTSTDGINWTIRSAAEDYNWNAVCYGNGLFVAVSSYGTGKRVMTSPDGIDWTLRNTPADYEWTSVVYGRGMFVATASGANLTNQKRLMTSPDGINWTAQSPPLSDIGLKGIAYGNYTFVVGTATTSSGRFMTSGSQPLQQFLLSVKQSGVDAKQGIVDAINASNGKASTNDTWTQLMKAIEALGADKQELVDLLHLKLIGASADESMHNLVRKAFFYESLNTGGNISFPVAPDRFCVQMYTSITINAGNIITTERECLGLVLIADGDIIINGTVDMNKKAPFLSSAPNAPFFFNRISGVDISLPSGGKTRVSNTSGKFNYGGDHGSGGNGGDNINTNSNTVRSGGMGASGGYGGPGTGGMGHGGGTGPGNPGSIVGGGGGGANFGNGTGGRGGRGPGGGGGGAAEGTDIVGGNGQDGDAYGGGLVILISLNGKIQVNGKITANGGNGGSGGYARDQVSSDVSYGGNGGDGGGGGVVALVAKTNIQIPGTISVNGGSGGAGGGQYNGGSSIEERAGYPGASGTNGIIIQKYI